MGRNEQRLQDLLFDRPLVNATFVAKALDVSAVTAGRLLDHLTGLGVIEEITGQRRNRVFRYAPYLQLFREHSDLVEPDTPRQLTESES